MLGWAGPPCPSGSYTYVHSLLEGIVMNWCMSLITYFTSDL